MESPFFVVWLLLCCFFDSCGHDVPQFARDVTGQVLPAATHAIVSCLQMIVALATATVNLDLQDNQAGAFYFALACRSAGVQGKRGNKWTIHSRLAWEQGATPSI